MSSPPVPASIPVLRWAAYRARKTDIELELRFPKWPRWISGEARPTLKQLESFALFTHTPFGYFFLPEPPRLSLPLPDFRTLRDQELTEPSPELLDVIFLCQQRQDWYRDHARLHGESALPFVGSANTDEAPSAVAQRMRETLRLSIQERHQMASWEEALRQLIARAEDAGVLVMTSAVVGSNSHRKLDVGEFRGFAMADTLAPLVFLNGADSKAAQMFSLGHELAHIWLGVSGVSDAIAGRVPLKKTERWCNQVAAELLMPMEDLHKVYNAQSPLQEELQRLARVFKVSTLVVLRRLHDAGFLSEDRLWHLYYAEQERLLKYVENRKAGGDFYRSLGARTSKRFARAVLTSTLEGTTLFRDAYQLLGIRKSSTFLETARKLEVIR